MREVVVLTLLAFVVAVAIVLGERLSTEAMSVVIGVVCGAAAGMPMSVLMMLALTRRRSSERGVEPIALTRQQAPYPPVVVIQGSALAPGTSMPPYYPGTVEAAPRQFHIVGEEGE